MSPDPSGTDIRHVVRIEPLSARDRIYESMLSSASLMDRGPKGAIGQITRTYVRESDGSLTHIGTSVLWYDKGLAASTIGRSASGFQQRGSPGATTAPRPQSDPMREYGEKLFRRAEKLRRESNTCAARALGAVNPQQVADAASQAGTAVTLLVEFGKIAPRAAGPVGVAVTVGVGASVALGQFGMAYADCMNLG